MNIAAVFAVVNAEGNLIIEERMDNAILVSVEVAYKKAYTAAALKLNTEDLTALVQPGAMFYGLQSDPKYIVFGGGMLLKINGKNSWSSRSKWRKCSRRYGNSKSLCKCF